MSRGHWALASAWMSAASVLPLEGTRNQSSAHSASQSPTLRPVGPQKNQPRQTGDVRAKVGFMISGSTSLGRRLDLRFEQS